MNLNTLLVYRIGQYSKYILIFYLPVKEFWLLLGDVSLPVRPLPLCRPPTFCTHENLRLAHFSLMGDIQLDNILQCIIN